MPPSRLFVRLREDLAPFAYEVPPEYNAHVGTLKEAGCRDTPTSTDLLQIFRVRKNQSVVPCLFDLNQL